MRRLNLGFSLVFALTSTGCLESGSDSSEPDAQAPGLPDGGIPLSIVEPPQVGDALGEGTVVSVDEVGSGKYRCTTAVLEKAANWQCSEQQLNDVNGGAGGARFATSSSSPSAAAIPSQKTQANRLQVTDCKGLADLRRPELKRNVQNTLLNARRQHLTSCLPTRRTVRFNADGEEVVVCPVAPVSPRTGSVFSPTPLNAGSPTSQASASAPQNASAPPAAASQTPVSTGSATSGATQQGASEYSTTNNQVADVDEADFVKNDDQYVYVLSAQGLHVIDAWPAKDTHEVQRLPLPGLGTRLFLHDSRLVVYVRPGDSKAAPSAAQACTYAYDCRFSAEPGRTTAIVYDVSNPSVLKELGRYDLSGGYIASRRVGSMVYTVVHDRPNAPTPPPFSTQLDASGAEALEASYEAALKAAEEKVDAMPDSAFVPFVEQARADGSVRARIESCDEALVAEAASGLNFISVVAFDLSTLNAPRRSMVASKPGFVYASSSALYMATEGVDGRDSFSGRGPNELSAIHKFAFESVGTRYVGTATVRGHLLNQFAMDEHEGVLRVATSSGQVPDPNVSSNLTTFSEGTGQFAKLGELTGLAPREDIRSVRFDGTRGFVVTFKKTDPLFVIDLAQPERPQVLGELKIPGFSTYMHPLDHDHLLALGLEADDKGSFAYFNGIQIQIFDISQLSDPKLVQKTVIGTRGSASDALTNHLAFNYFAPKALLALPMTVCDGGGQGMFGDKLSFSGLMLFDVSITAGIKERGRLPFVDPANATLGSCSSWWTNAKSVVKRSIIMDDYAIGISDSLYKVAPISALSKPFVSLPLSAAQ